MLPTFLIIGAMKAGTTSLHTYLGTHPDVFMSDPKEIGFFSDNWARGVAWYEEFFAAGAGAKARGESTPEYTKFPQYKDIPERIHSLMPECRLVYIVRHPIERMVSQYVHLWSDYGLRIPIDEALTQYPRFAATSDYALQIERFLDRFDREQLLVITSEDLKDPARRLETLRTVFGFIGVDPEWDPPNRDRLVHTSAEKLSAGPVRPRHLAFRRWRTARSGPTHLHATGPATELASATHARLIETLAPSLARLRVHLGDDFHCWGLLDGEVASPPIVVP